MSSVPATTMEACLQYKNMTIFISLQLKMLKINQRLLLFILKHIEEHTQQVKKAKDAGLWLD
ncbi:MAG: hypothetical protein ACLUIS_08485 [Longibaculum sp.]